MNQWQTWAVRALVFLAWLATLAGVGILAAAGATGGCLTVGLESGCVQPVFLGPTSMAVSTGTSLAVINYTNVGGYIALIATLALACAAATCVVYPQAVGGVLYATLAVLPTSITGIALTITAYFETLLGYAAQPFVYAGLLVATANSLAHLRSVRWHTDYFASPATFRLRSVLIIVGKLVGVIAGCVVVVLGFSSPWGVSHECLHGLCTWPFGGSSYTAVDGDQLTGALAATGGPLAQITFLAWLAAILIILLAVLLSSQRPKPGQMGLYLASAIVGLLAIHMITRYWQSGYGLQVFDQSGDCAAQHALCTFVGFGSGIAICEFGFALALLGSLLVLAGCVWTARRSRRTPVALSAAATTT